MVDGPEGLSLLWPAGPSQGAAEPDPRLSSEQAADLELDYLVNALSLDVPGRPYARDVLLGLCTDPDVIAYRQGVLDSIVRSPNTAARLEALLPRIGRLQQHHVPREKGEMLYEVAWRLGELDIFLECIGELADILGELTDPADGFRVVGAALRRLRDSELIRHLVAALPKLLKEVRGTRSITIGVNVDDDLQPSSVTLLSINAQTFGEHSPNFLRTLFGSPPAANGIAPLHRVPSQGPHAMLHPLFRDLSETLSRSLRPVASELQQFAGLHTSFLDRWGQELSFYLGAAKLVERLRRGGLPVCRPRVDVSGGFEVAECYNVVLALKLAEQGHEADLGRQVVRNDVAFGPHEISILTGPNQGGKTTFLRAVGLVHVMGQAGLCVPGTRAAIGPVDAIHTHFPRSERGELDFGRFADEMRRLRDLFAHATPASLILLNESLAATSAQESLELAREVVAALQVLAARAIYTTHLYELAAEAGSFNARTTGEGRVTSLIAQTGRSFRIEPGPPAGSSQAREVARRHGISYAQLIDVLRDRGIVTPGSSGAPGH